MNLLIMCVDVKIKRCEDVRVFSCESKTRYPGPPCHSLGGVGVVYFVVDFGFSLLNGFCTLQNGSSINLPFTKWCRLSLVLINNYVRLS